MNQELQSITDHLAASRVDRALKAAAKFCETDAKHHHKEHAVAIAGAVATAWRQFHTAAVHQFIDEADGALDPHVSPIVRQAIKRLFDTAEKWKGQVLACHDESLARDLRDRLREKNYQASLENVGMLFAGVGSEDAALVRRGKYIGNVLGTCINHPMEADQLIQLVWQSRDVFDVPEAAIHAMKEAKDESHSRFLRAGVENLENQFVTELKRVQVEILQSLPPKNLLGDPTPEELRDVGDIFRSVLRVPLDLDRPDMFADVTELVVDFLPKETSATARASGVEMRSYEQMAFRSRKAVAQVLMDIGAGDVFPAAYLNWGKNQLDHHRGEHVIELMGSLRSHRLEGFLISLWHVPKRKNEFRRVLSVAIGNLASPEAAEVLLEELKEVFENKPTSVGEKFQRIKHFGAGGKTVDQAGVRRAKALLEGLGQIVRSPRTEDSLRRRIVARVREMVPEDHSALQRLVVSEVLAARPDSLDAEQRQWAIEHLVDSLWIQDQTTDMHKGGERETTIMGGRAQIARGIQRLAKGHMGPVLAQIDRRSTRFSGGMIAAAEILKSVKDPRAIPVLGKMLMHAAVHEESEESSYQKETYWDSTDQERKPLTKDKILSVIIEAIGTIDTSDGERILEELRKKIETGRVNVPPAGETIQTLGRYIGPPGTTPKQQADKKAEDSTGGLASSDEAHGEPGKAQRQRALVDVDPAELRKLLKALTGTHFLMSSSKKIQTKVEALVRLGQLTPPEALDDIFVALLDKEAVVQSAAITTAAEYGAPGKPDYLLNRLVEKLGEAFDSKERDLRNAALKILAEIGPRRPEVRKPMAAFAKVAHYPEMRERIAEAIGSGKAKTVVAGSSDTVASAEKGAGAKGEPLPAGLSKLEVKRQYMQARRAWIDGGKRGPEPPRPPELDND